MHARYRCPRARAALRQQWPRRHAATLVLEPLSATQRKQLNSLLVLVVARATEHSRE